MAENLIERKELLEKPAISNRTFDFKGTSVDEILMEWQPGVYKLVWIKHTDDGMPMVGNPCFHMNFSKDEIAAHGIDLCLDRCRDRIRGSFSGYHRLVGPIAMQHLSFSEAKKALQEHIATQK